MIYLVGTALCFILVNSNLASSQAEPTNPITPIEHVVVLMQENHTFDNYFGTYPGADGFPEGLCVPVNPFDPDIKDCVEPFHIGDLPIENLDHSRSTFRLQYNEGRMDGFIRALDIRNQEGRLAMGYYDGRDLPFYWNLADDYVLFDQFFSSASAGSFLNHVYWVTGTPGMGEDKATLEGLRDIPTIFDRLMEVGVTWKFYIQKYDPNITYRNLVEGAPRPPQVEWVPLLNLDRYIDNPDLFKNIVELNQYYEDLEAENLPGVSFIKVIGSSEHPPGSLQAGQRAARTMIHALMQSSHWENSAFIVTYDDWGGWYDHVPPPQVDEYGYGFRVPTLLVSPFAKQGYIDSTILDYTSILRFIEDNWNLDSLSVRDAKANSIINAFDFNQEPRPAHIIPSTRYFRAQGSDPNTLIISLAYAVFLLMALIIIYWAWKLQQRRTKSDLNQNLGEGNGEQ
jgi:phospholipase C